MAEPSQTSVTRQKISATTLANAAELISGVIGEIAGNDISTSLNGESATVDMIQNIALQRITKNIISASRV